MTKQDDTVLKQCLQPRQYPGEAARGIDNLGKLFIATASKASVGDGDKGRAILLGRKSPLYGCLPMLAGPLDDDSAIGFDEFHIHRCRCAIHLPFPDHPFASFKPTTAFGKPEFCGDLRVDKGFEDFGDWFADQHSG